MSIALCPVVHLWVESGTVFSRTNHIGKWKLQLDSPSLPHTKLISLSLSLYFRILNRIKKNYANNFVLITVTMTWIDVYNWKVVAKPYSIMYACTHVHMHTNSLVNHCSVEWTFNDHKIRMYVWSGHWTRIYWNTLELPESLFWKTLPRQSILE